MSFANPHLLWLAALAPLAVAAAVWLWRRRLAAAAAWAARGLWDRLLGAYRPRRLATWLTLGGIALLGASLSLAQPRWGRGEETVERRGADVVFVLDSSLSMGATDVTPSRLFVAKALVRRLAAAMPQNRVALIQAEGTGEVLAPLTTDGAVIDLLMDTIEPGSLPNPGTELAPSLDRATELFLEDGPKHRVLVLLSDGEDHGGGVESRLERLAEAGVVIHTVGIGTLEGAPVPLPGTQGRDYRRQGGKLVVSRLEEEVLESAARATGGVYLRATQPGIDLSPLVRHIEAMGSESIESQTVDTTKERFQWPLAAAALALFLQLALGPFAPREARP